MTRPQNIVVIVADSLRYDSVYRDGDPKLPYTQKNAVQFTQARSAGCWTLPSHASLFTGLMPHEHHATSQTRSLNPNAPTMAERLKSAGYSTQQITANVATTEIFGLDRGFDRVIKIWDLILPRVRSFYKSLVLLGKPRVRKLLLSHDGITNQLTKDLKVGNCWVQNTHNDIFRQARRLLREGRQNNQPTFLFINLMETHFPYHVGPTFRLSASSWRDRLGELAGLYHMVNQTFLTSEREHISPRIGEILRNRQYKSWDLLAKPLDRFIRDVHKDKENLVVFLADHGDNFGEQDWYYHFTNVTDAGNRIPMMWLGHDHPGARTIDQAVSARGLYDSILDAAGMDHHGSDLFTLDSDSLPVMQSYWYNNNGRTLSKYKYNQLAFIEDGQRYLYRSGDWFSAPVQAGIEEEAEFEPLDRGTDPITEAVNDPSRKRFLDRTLREFEDFSARIPA